MKLLSKLFLLILSLFASVIFLGCSKADNGEQSTPTPVSVEVEVEVEEVAYTYVFPDNQSFPLHDYMSTQIARVGATPETSTVVVSAMETGEDVPLWCNTRWHLLRRDDQGWTSLARPDAFLQRDPCPIAVTASNNLFLYVNNSTEPQGTPTGYSTVCVPHLLRFDMNSPTTTGQALMPQWAGENAFSPWGYRGFAADREREELLMLNADWSNNSLRASLLSAQGATLAMGTIIFPIRSLYPEAVLADRAVYVLAVSDILEPIEEWRAYVYEQTGSEANYTFRILYYTWTPNLIQQDFAQPIEIANVEATAGYIRNQDIWVAPDGTAYLMYSDQEVQTALLRDRFFPDKSIQTHLKLAIVKGNRIVERRNLLDGKGFDEPPCARFHITPDGIVYAVIYAPGPNYSVGENLLLQIFPKVHNPQSIPIPLGMPLQSFLIASARAGNAPSFTIDFLGQDNPWWSETMYYAKVDLTHTY